MIWVLEHLDRIVIAAIAIVLLVVQIISFLYL